MFVVNDDMRIWISRNKVDECIKIYVLFLGFLSKVSIIF